MDFIFATEPFAEFKPHIAAACCVVKQKDEFLLLRRTRVMPGFWSSPGGGVEAGESSLDAAARELDEETGLKPTLNNYKNTKRFYIRTPIFGDYTLDAFYINYQTKPEVTLNPEHDNYLWLNLEKALLLKLIPGAAEVLKFYA